MALTRSIGARQDATRGTAPVEVRKGIAAQYVRPGVLPGGATPLVTGTSSTSGMTYNVGAAGFVTSRGVSDGYHLYTNDGSVAIGTTGVGSTIPAAPSTGLKRVDIIWVLHPSAGDNADTSSAPVFGVTSGAAHSSPQPPTIPTGALELARNEMSAGVTSTAMSGNSITQTAPYTAVKGGIVPVRNLAERDAASGLATAAHPLVADRLDVGILERNAGAGWVSITGSASGVVDVPLFSLPAQEGTSSLVPGVTLNHGFSGPVIVEANLVGDLVVGANSSARLTLAVNTVNRFGWVQNFGSGNIRDSPTISIIAPITAGVPVNVYVAVSNIGSGGVSAAAGSLQVDWLVRPQ